MPSQRLSRTGQPARYLASHTIAAGGVVPTGARALKHRSLRMVGAARAMQNGAAEDDEGEWRSLRAALSLHPVPRCFLGGPFFAQA